MQCSLFLSLHFVVYGHAVGADGLADIAHGDMAGIDLVGVQVIHRLKLGDEHGVVVVLADVARDLALFELRDHAVERGELSKVADWLREYVFSCASVMDPDEWIRHITGESLTPDYYLSYLEEKYSKLYELK